MRSQDPEFFGLHTVEHAFTYTVHLERGDIIQSESYSEPPGL